MPVDGSAISNQSAHVQVQQNTALVYAKFIQELVHKAHYFKKSGVSMSPFSDFSGHEHTRKWPTSLLDKSTPHHLHPGAFIQ